MDTFLDFLKCNLIASSIIFLIALLVYVFREYKLSDKNSVSGRHVFYCWIYLIAIIIQFMHIEPSFLEHIVYSIILVFLLFYITSYSRDKDLTTILLVLLFFFTFIIKHVVPFIDLLIYVSKGDLTILDVFTYYFGKPREVKLLIIQYTFKLICIILYLLKIILITSSILFFIALLLYVNIEYKIFAEDNDYNTTMYQNWNCLMITMWFFMLIEPNLIEYIVFSSFGSYLIYYIVTYSKNQELATTLIFLLAFFVSIIRHVLPFINILIRIFS